MILPLLVGGLVTLLGQVALLREVIVANQGNELAAVLGLGCWLVGGAIGAALGYRDRRVVVSGPPAWRWPLVGLALSLPIGVVLARLQRDIFGTVPGAGLTLGETTLGLILVLLPASALGGALLRRAAAGAVRRGLPLVRAYAVESAGGLVGGAAATLLLHFGLSNSTQVLAASALAACVAAASGRGDRGRRVALMGLAGALALAALLAAPTLDHELGRRERPGLLKTRDTPYGRVAVARLDGQVALYADGGLVRATGGAAAAEFCGLVVLQASRLDRVAVLEIGGWAEVAQALTWGAGHVDWVVTDGAALDLLRSARPSELAAILASKRVTVHRTDPRRWLATQAELGAVLLVAPEPTSGRTSRFFTREFFVAVRRSLGREGVFGLGLPAVANVWTPSRSRRDASIWRALGAAFSERLVLTGETGLYFIAAPVRLERDPEVLAARLEDADVSSSLLSAPYLRYLMTSDRHREARGTLDQIEVRANTDARPVCYAYSLALWLARQVPRWIWRPPTISGDGLRAAAAVIAGVGGLVGFLLLGTRRRQRARRALVVGIGGGAGLVLEAVLLLHYQLQHGVLYLDLGLLLMAFMAGLAGGGWLAEPLARHAGAEAARSGGALALLALAIVALTQLGIAPGLFITALLQAAIGAGTALLFALAAVGEQGEQERLAGPLLAADLFGGAVASVATALLLVPWLGLTGTAAIGAVLAAVAAILARGTDRAAPVS